MELCSGTDGSSYLHGCLVWRGSVHFIYLIPNPIVVGSTSTGSVLVGCRIAFVDVQITPPPHSGVFNIGLTL